MAYFSELSWAILLLIFLVPTAAFLFYKIKQKNHQEADGSKMFPIEVLFYVNLSLIVVTLILIGNYIYTPSSDGEIFKALSYGEVLVGICIAYPAIYTWLMTYQNEKKNELEKEEERKKDKIEIEIYNLQKEYSEWLIRFSETEKVTLADRVILSSIIEKADKIESDYDNIINYLNLFVIVQEKLWSSYDHKGLVFENSEWRNLITKIIMKIINANNTKSLENIIKSEKTKDIFGIDFSWDTISDNLLNIDVQTDSDFNFTGCKIKAEDLTRNLFNNPNVKKFNECVWIGKPEFNDKEFEGNQYNEALEIYIIDNIDEETNNSSDSESKEENSNQNAIFENRDLSGKAINEWLLNKNSIQIELDTGMNVKSTILEKIIELYPKELGDVSPENILFSKSKNYVDDMKDGQRWAWHSWNVITEKAIDKNENFKYVVFAVENGNNTYVCLVFNRDNFNKMLDQKSKIKDDRYFFYFGKVKKENQLQK
ncbi:hypothetical protein ACQTPQ_01135 [Streptococcus hyovaginalis]|uniref:hypothetical protein n=1 Tax=Streptococcus hyovaginalis TaxID=149015 RepID=UPI003AD9CB53